AGTARGHIMPIEPGERTAGAARARRRRQAPTRSRRAKADTPTTLAARPSATSHTPAVQFGSAAGAGVMCRNGDVSRSQWFESKIEAIVSTRNDQTTSPYVTPMALLGHTPNGSAP